MPLDWVDWLARPRVNADSSGKKRTLPQIAPAPGQLGPVGSETKYDILVLDKALESAARVWFDQRARTWQAETLFYSSISSIIRHPAFSAIVGMGPLAAKFIFARMSTGDVKVIWFPVLKEIYPSADPVAEKDRGNVRAMSKAWLGWARANHAL